MNIVLKNLLKRVVLYLVLMVALTFLGKTMIYANSAGGNLKVHFIDVGQADCILINCDEEFMLIDAGNNADADTVVNYLENEGVDTLKYVIGTHPHEDHIGSLDTVINTFHIQTIIMPDITSTTQTFADVISAIENQGLNITDPIVGNEYSIGNATFTIIAPNSTYGNDTNNWSVGIKLVNGNNSFVMCGDAEEESEMDMINNGIDISADVLKVNHHGSSSSTTTAFLNAIDPTYAVISVGKDNDYGHPTLQTLQRLVNTNVKIFRTDEQGTIIATSDGTTITWNTEPSTSMNPGK